MKARIIILVGLVVLGVQCQNRSNKEQTTGPVSEEAPAVPEKTTVWLFDGSTTDHFRDTKSESFPDHGWEVDGEVLTVLGKTEEHDGGHDIITKETFSNFDLELEVMLSEGANSGIKYFVTDSFPGNEGSFLGLEYQLLDNERHPDALNGREGNHKMASLYDMIPPPEGLTIHPPGEWNKVRIVVDGNKVEHWLNGEKVLEFDRKSQEFRDLVAMSKYKNLEKFGELDQGRLLLQGHGNTVSFRSIKITTW